MRAICVLASYEPLQRNDEPSLLQDYVGKDGLEEIKVTYDAYSETDADGDGDVHTEHIANRLSRDELVVTDADELALLSGAVAFRAGSGRAPRLPDTGPLFESIRDSLSPHIDQSKVYYKLKRLKSKFCNTALSATSTAHDRRVRDLSAAIWAADLAPPPPPSPPPALALEEANHDDDDDDPEEDDDGYAPPNVAVGPRMPLVSDLLGEYWKRNARSLSGVSLEKGLALVGADEGRVVEAKWRRQLDAEMRSQVRRHDLAKEVFALLIDTVKGLGP
jgi:hypothetical protein